MAAAGLAILIVLTALAFSSGGVLIGRRLIRDHIAGFHNEVVISLFASASVIYAVLLGFLVVVVWEAYDDAHRNVAEEAAMLTPLFRLTYGMQGPHGAASRTLIREYARAVIDDEWKTMDSAKAGSMRARRAVGDLDRQFSRLTPAQKAADAQVDAEFLRTKSLVVADRNRRLLEASDTIPDADELLPLHGAALAAHAHGESDCRADRAPVVHHDRAEPAVSWAARPRAGAFRNCSGCDGRRGPR